MNNDSHDEAALRDLYEAMYRGMLQKSRAILERVLAREFVLVHMTGMRQTREQFITAVEDGTLNYFSASTESVTVQVGDHSATVVGKSRVNAAVFGGGRYTWPLEQDLTCHKTAGGWQFVKSVASTY